MIRWPEVRELEKTAASSGEAEVAEDDATAITKQRPKLASVTIPGGYPTHMSLVATFTWLNEKSISR